MIKLVSFKICPFVQRITGILEAKSIAYEIEYISLSAKPRWFLDISPNAQVPVLITESGTPLFESDAIAEFLEDAYPPFDPELTPEQKALNRAWSYQASKHYLVQCGAQRSSDLSTLKERGAKLKAAFDRVEKVLGDGPYFAGDQLGMVDLAWLVLLHRAHFIEQRTGYDFVGSNPKVKAWQAALMATGLAEKSVAPDFDEAFAAFYLSESTYLGRGCDVGCSDAGQGCATGTCC